jgi:hypothetical protein
MVVINESKETNVGYQKHGHIIKKKQGLVADVSVEVYDAVRNVEDEQLSNTSTGAVRLQCSHGCSSWRFN